MGSCVRCKKVKIHKTDEVMLHHCECVILCRHFNDKLKLHIFKTVASGKKKSKNLNSNQFYYAWCMNCMLWLSWCVVLKCLHIVISSFQKQKLFPLIEIRAGLLFKPNKHYVAELEKRDYLGKAKVPTTLLSNEYNVPSLKLMSSYWNYPFSIWPLN